MICKNNPEKFFLQKNITQGRRGEHRDAEKDAETRSRTDPLKFVDYTPAGLFFSTYLQVISPCSRPSAERILLLKLLSEVRFFIVIVVVVLLGSSAGTGKV
jgi:hypothetical protein